MIETQDAADAEAERRFTERAMKIRDDMLEAYHEALPGNHSPAQAVLLAHLMTCIDGYYPVVFAQDWEKRPRPTWGTALGFIAEVDSRLVVDFAFECRYGVFTRQLAVAIDWHRPGEQLPHKQARISALQARGWRVLMFSELEVLTAPEACRERVEEVLADMVDETLVDAGVIPGRPDSR